MGNEKLEVTVDSMIGERTTTKRDLHPEQKVKDVLDEVSLEQGVPVRRMSLVKDGEILPREKTLRELGIQTGQLLHILPHDTRGGTSFAQIHERRIEFERRELLRKRADLRQISRNIWEGSVEGTGRWSGQRIRIRIQTPPTYPIERPRIYVRDALRPEHPNVWPDGELCMNHTGDDWNPNLTLAALMESFRQVLAKPNYEHPARRMRPAPRRDNWLRRLLSG